MIDKKDWGRGLHRGPFFPCARSIESVIGLPHRDDCQGMSRQTGVADSSGCRSPCINAAAQRYRGVIPEDRWSDPYMSASELADEIEAGSRATMST